MLRRTLPVLLPAGMLLGGALIALAALLLASASETPESVGAQVCGEVEVPLAVGCNPVTSTFPNSTPIATIAGCVSPPAILFSIWEYEGSTATWLGYSPVAPPWVSDLTQKDFLAVAFLCVDASGIFRRPAI